ncbi:hypothetical protein GYMLUDRAFT_253167 [Collybiopsis luxurians FD-317 M1]|uniref:Unplaced genomic scaffold GYMLUscaffold_170, whole genome shotgun sequence n=1 Tax=Collybiopsis luxurians FD-317 M1 TaxID=944289 RepID=A0A0D0BXL1_9AGAR|nr:hypothetical protein GYMLUDRAFT_253167 [Collybiopsis luxurians FD-317 M1]
MSYSGIRWACEADEETDIVASKIKTHPSGITQTMQEVGQGLESEIKMASMLNGSTPSEATLPV